MVTSFLESGENKGNGDYCAKIVVNSYELEMSFFL